MALVKVAWVRNPEAPAGTSAPGRLRCPCGEAPESYFKPGPAVRCPCGRVYRWDGFLQRERPSRSESQMIAEIIIEKLGGLGKLRAMVSAHSFVSLGNGLQFGFRGSRKANKCRIELSPLDLYDMVIGQVRKGEFREIYRESGLYWDMLKPEFEKATGLDLAL